MQLLKTDIRKRILSVARNEFVQNGMRQTSIRTVAQKAGVAVGNVYHYFRSKDELFCEVMRPLIRELDRYILSHNSEEHLSIEVFNLWKYQEEYMFDLLQIIKDFRPELRLLLFNSKGTSLANYKEKIGEHQMQVGMEYMRLMKERYPHLNIDISPFFMHLTCSAWVTLFCELVEHDEYDEKEIKEALKQYAAFGMGGWKELMKP